jgi:hypothetical protein
VNSGLERHAKETPIPNARPLLMRALALRTVCNAVGGALFQATVPHELFLVLLALARGNALSVIFVMFIDVHSWLLQQV